MIGEVVRLTHSQTVKQWEFPPSKFVTYTKSDEAWARPLGFGREVTVERTFTTLFQGFQLPPTFGHLANDFIILELQPQLRFGELVCPCDCS